MLAAIVTVAAVFVIPVPHHLPPQGGVSVKSSVDWIGAVLVTVGLFALLFALTEGNVVGWSTPWVPVLIVISVILITAFVFWQRHLERTGIRPPLMKVSIFSNARFTAAMCIMALFFSSFNGFLVYATFVFQDYQGLSPLQTTLRFIPTGVSGIATAIIVAPLLARIPTYMILLFGNTCVSLSSLLFAVPIDYATTSYFAYGLPAMVLSVLGADTTWPSLTLFTSEALPQSDQALGGALVNSMGQVGRSLGLAVATAIQTAVMARARGVDVTDTGPIKNWDEPSLQGLRAASWWNFALGICSMVVVAVVFRSSQVIGKSSTPKTEAKAEQLPPHSGGEEGIMNQQDTKV
jgi:hypothetical protein